MYNVTVPLSKVRGRSVVLNEHVELLLFCHLGLPPLTCSFLDRRVPCWNVGNDASHSAHNYYFSRKER